MADIKQAIDYAKQNPNSAFSTELRRRIESGQMNKELQTAGLNQYVTDTPSEKGYISRVTEQYGKAGGDVKSAVTKGADMITEGQQQGGIKGIFKQAVGMGKSALGTLGGVARASVAPILEAPVIKQGVEAIGEAIAPTIQSGLETDTGQKLITFAKQYPEAFKSLQDTVDLATLGLGKAVVRPLEKATYIAVNTAEKTLPVIGKATSKSGEKLFKTAIDLTVDEAELVQGNTIKKAFIKKEMKKVAKGSDEYKTLQGQLELANKNTPVTRSDTALQKGIFGTETSIGKQAGVEKLRLWKNNIEPALVDSEDKITKDELFTKAKQTVESELEPGRKQALQDAYDALVDDYKDFTDTDLLTANKIKTSLDNFTPTKIFKGKEVASEYKTLKADLASAIRDKTYTSLKDEKIKEAYRDYSNLKQLEKVGIKALTDGGLKGGFGGFWTTMYDKAATPIKTVGGQVLYRVGNKLEFIGDKGIKTLGEHLNKKGVKLKIPTKKTEAVGTTVLQGSNEQ